MTDAHLVQAALAHDARAFAALVVRYQDQARALGYSATGDPAAAEDVAQEAFLVAWRRLASLNDPERFGPWLAGIVRNVARGSRRHLRRHAPGSRQGGGISVECLRGLAAEQPSPLDQVAAREDLARAWQALATLPPRYRDTLILYCRLGRSCARVAASLGLSQETVRQRLSRARSKLRRSLDHAETPASIERTLARSAGRRSLAASVVALVWSRQAHAALVVRPAAAGRWAAGGGRWLSLAAAPAAAISAAAVVVAAFVIAVTGPPAAASVASAPAPAATAARGVRAAAARAAVAAPAVETRRRPSVQRQLIRAAAPVPAAPEVPARSRPRHGHLRGGRVVVTARPLPLLRRPSLTLADLGDAVWP